MCTIIKSLRNVGFFSLICFIFVLRSEFQGGRDTCFLLESLLSHEDKHRLLVFHLVNCRLMCLSLYKFRR